MKTIMPQKFDLKIQYEDLMREIDIIKENIRCCDDFDVYPNDSINITYELWFDVDKYFGTHTRESSSWINFYTFYHKDGRITAMYEIDYDDHMESFDWELTAEEEFFFRNMMNRYCNKLYGCSVPALWSERETA